MDNSSVNIDLIRDHVDTIILSTLANGDRYGLEILTEIKDKSKGLYELKQPTLYSCLKRLEKLGYVTSYKGDSSNGAQRVYYSLLDDGRKFLENDQYQWEYSRTIINGLLSDKDFDPTSTPPFQASDLRPRTKRQPRSEPSAAESASVYDNQIVLNEPLEDAEEGQMAFNLDSPSEQSDNSAPIHVQEVPADYQQTIKIVNPDLKTVIVNKDSVIYEQDVDYVGVLGDIFHGSVAPKQPTGSYASYYASQFGDNSGADYKVNDAEYASNYSLESISSKFASQGFTIKPYYKKNTTEFYVNKYIYINKILAVTSLYSYAVFAILLTILHLSTMNVFGTPVSSFLIPLLVALAVPAALGLNYVIDPNKKIIASFDLKKTLSTASIFLVNAFLLIILIGFVGFKANFVDLSTIVQPIVFPTIMILTIPVSILIYSWLYSSTHYHVN
ncbi:MAG: PadR family transcriptional regulator [Clostridiales bacterium]|nr:PadR family transcriptional regulator [Clostridiales bacterium]